MKDQAKIPLGVLGDIPLDKIHSSSWDFYFHKENMLSSKELDKLTETLKVNHLPEIFFGKNRFFMVNKQANFVYEFNPCQMIDLTSYEVRKDHFDRKKIYHFPADAKVQYHNTWKDLKLDRDDIQKVEPKEDWTYCSPYLGHFSTIPESPLKDIYPEIKDIKEFKVEETKNKLPVHKLGPDNPIIEYVEIPLYDDELNDNGHSETKFRFRVMKDSFFGLLRSYLRVDNVLVRNIDTRIYHEFGTKVVYRNHQVKEVTYEELIKKGFQINSGWSLSPNQSDLIGQHMGQPVFEISDHIILK